MRIQYISDIHLEFLHIGKIQKLMYNIQPHAEICVLAGDIGNPLHKNDHYKTFLLDVSTKFKKTFVIAGNHEFYGNPVNETISSLQHTCDNIPNISFLNNSFEDYEGFRFIGSTQWTKIHDRQYTINDINNIQGLTVNKYNALHLESVNFLQNTLTECRINNRKSIVITHHLPIYELTNEKYRNDFFVKYSQWFNADLDELIKKNKAIISGWIYGHTHSRSVQTHHDVVFYCNPIGYAGENTYSDVNMVCDISSEV